MKKLIILIAVVSVVVTAVITIARICASTNSAVDSCYSTCIETCRKMQGLKLFDNVEIVEHKPTRGLIAVKAGSLRISMQEYGDDNKFLSVQIYKKDLQGNVKSKGFLFDSTTLEKNSDEHYAYLIAVELYYTFKNELVEKELEAEANEVGIEDTIKALFEAKFEDAQKRLRIAILKKLNHLDAMEFKGDNGVAVHGDFSIKTYPVDEDNFVIVLNTKTGQRNIGLY